MKNKFFILLVVLIAIFAGAFVYLKQTTSADSQQTAQSGNSPQSAEGSFRMVPYSNTDLVKAHSPTKGAENAKVTLVEFLDPECEACAATYPMVKKIMQEFGKDLRVVVRYMPYHQNSKFAANILEGARAQDKYWEALDLLFATQGQWANHHHPQPELIPEILKPLGLVHMEMIVADAKAGKFDAMVMADYEDGKRVGVQGTPTFFINGKKLEELSYEALRSAVAQAVD